jgi:hypothetical protein
MGALTDRSNVTFDGAARAGLAIRLHGGTIDNATGGPFGAAS